MASPLTLADWISRTIMPTSDVTALEASEPGYLQNRLDMAWSWVGSRLSKRYDVAAMAVNPPAIVLLWLTDLVSKAAYDKRGYNPSSETDKAAILDAFTDAKAEVKEASDAKDGLFDLPLLATKVGESGVSRGFPLGYSEESPYTWTTIQAINGSHEDGQ